jgi:hypothetical protein
VIRAAWLALFSSTLLCAQEDGMVKWDPKFDGPTPVWQEIVGLAVIGLSLYAHWRLAKWFIDHRRDRPKWRPVRFWWPSLMLTLAGAAVLLGHLTRNSPGDFAYDAVVLLAFFFNIPIAPAALLVGLFIDQSAWRGWSIFLLIVPSAWASWYGIIRFLEWRSFCGAPISLHSDTTYSPPPQS